MINNYQSEAGEEDDRDSSSLTILASLKEGDQVGARKVYRSGSQGFQGLFPYAAFPYAATA